MQMAYGVILRKMCPLIKKKLLTIITLEQFPSLFTLLKYKVPENFMLPFFHPRMIQSTHFKKG